MSLRDIFNAILDFNLLYIIYVLIGAGIIILFSKSNKKNKKNKVFHAYMMTKQERKK